MTNPKWSLLNNGHPIIKNIIDDWQSLLDENHQERTYHDFIKEHANLFLTDGLDSHFAISKLKLGSELELDFAVPSNEYSRGLSWELIEIKTPQAAPYTESGDPSATLTKATQQIRNWKRWIQDSRNEAKKIFSTWSLRTDRQPNFRYTIIIGNRENSAKWINERDHYSDENRINVRSFDYLTERLKRRIFTDQAYAMDGAWDNEHSELGKQLANPFVKAFTDSQWKELLREPNVSSPHFISRSCNALLNHRMLNDARLEEFKEWLSKADI